MALEQSEHEVTPAAIHTISSVAEAIALLSSYAVPEQHAYAQHEHGLMHQALSAESIAFLAGWRSRNGFDFMYLYEFFIPFPYFNDLTLFLDEIAKLSDEAYLGCLLGGELTQEQIASGLQNPDAIADFGSAEYSSFGDKPEFIKVLLTELESIRASIHLVLTEIAASEALRSQQETRQGLYEAALQNARAFGLEPLPLAQKLMGKTFQRVSSYQSYYFIPSYYLSPHRIRLFDHNTCIVIYGCYSAQLNILEQSQELEKQMKALSDRNRIVILRMLHQRREYGARLANALDITTATVSHHLEILKQAELIIEEKAGNIKYFRLNQARFNKLLKDLSLFIEVDNM
ncbi:metalloregulator ArsR/SmtB family transcription factor [Paenibacillus sp. MMS20-IR301]|uniref:ArsR/SmtB family transcription factor n=1 Tax=Paenibacillus sp. MMS20-IR301 TaxID=2895946 RepID=UPI0028E258D3|nr:metalloregulator ArsR/SmtB family transcription factor [Paenibacillus sp. MMS20-IR301]WNS45980.1 metalloregulator ArsR/SmtB family transcription factor [Paenibacillus sp. MMS20-IR301]